MNVLVIIGECITINSSANLCHLSYLQGLVDAGIHVSLLSASPSDYTTDSSMKIPNEVNSKFIHAVSFYERLSLIKKKSETTQENRANDEKNASHAQTRAIVSKVKKLIRALYGPHGIEATFYRKSKSVRYNGDFDFVISISHPPISHKVAHRLIKTRHVITKHWIQIWEDPWYIDICGNTGIKNIFNEERRIVSYADKICYVSPITLLRQQRLFPDSAKKMFWRPLPSYYVNAEEAQRKHGKNVYGYFGDYVPATRDLSPFYFAAKEMGIETFICGNPHHLFEPTENIHIRPRLMLKELIPIENETNVLIFLCNREGGQIPGKIYQYSATTKTILFILDGSEEEKRELRRYFEQFNRYIFCQNTKEDIIRVIQRIESGNLGAINNIPIDDFNPRKIIGSILEEGSRR